MFTCIFSLRTALWSRPFFKQLQFADEEMGIGDVRQSQCSKPQNLCSEWHCHSVSLIHSADGTHVRCTWHSHSDHIDPPGPFWAFLSLLQLPSQPENKKQTTTTTLSLICLSRPTGSSDPAQMLLSWSSSIALPSSSSIKPSFPMIVNILIFTNF